MPALTIIKDNKLIGTFPLYNRDLIVGSNKYKSDIVLTGEGVSETHNKIIYNNNLYSIIDLKTEKGTYINGEKILYKVLNIGDKIKIGGYEIIFEESSTEKILEEVDPSLEGANRLEEDTQTPDRQKLSIIYQLSETIDSISDLSKLLEKAASLIFQTFNADIVFIGLFDSEEQKFDLTITKEKEFNERSSTSVSLTLIEWVKKHKKAYLTSDATEDDIFKESRSIHINKIKSTMCAPLILGNDVIGTIYVDNRSLTHQFSSDDLKLLSALSKLLSISIEKARSHQIILNENRMLKSMQRGIETELIGNSPKINKLRRDIEIYASKGNSNILISGETGSGKELVARSIHAKSVRSNKPFVIVNCSAIPESMIESELFGFEKWAFTDAKKPRRGKFELADGGTLFLDEIGDMSLSAQSKILRAIEHGEIQRIGSEKTIEVDVRIISATNKNLFEEIKKGNFRQDLFYRLCTVELHVPPLRERKEDIPLLVNYFINLMKNEIHTNIEKISNEALKILLNHDWPGNVRELKMVIERSLYCPSEDTLLPEHLPPLKGLKEITNQPKEEKSYDIFFDSTEIVTLREVIELTEKKYIEKVLRFCHGKKSEAARFLNISRYTLDRKIEFYGLTI